ncbi:MAG: HEAT repeat domain-containing protein [Microcoleus vaginatus WJT46-NPBG5]|jgi:HEAT repeat protein|nr:HEAT repeat domain-containing protein [Microcoleus vaginatus WJT46-NPBG5]
MNQPRKPRGIRATEEGLLKLRQAKAKRDEDCKPLSYKVIADQARIDERTVKRFFAGDGVDKDSAIAICQALALKITEIVDQSEWNPPPDDSIDWHQVCHAMLNKRPLRTPASDRHRGHEIKIHVPLGLVKPSRQAKREEADSPMAAEGTQQYRLSEKEIERQFEESEFFREVIDQQGKNLAIIGEPGAGKSTWMDCIARHLDREGNPHGFPICIPLGNLQGKQLKEYLQQIWLKDALPDLDAGAVEVNPALEAKLVQLFNSGKVWLLLDGADEMRVAESNSPLKEIANQLIGWVAKARVAISCRLNVWETNDKALFDFETYRTLDFDQAGVADFIEQWFKEAGKPKLGKKLQAKLAEPEKDRIRDLVKNPLRLSLLCKTWDDREDLPETKAGLYQRFRENFYNWKKDEFLTSFTQQQELNARLARLALAALERKMPLRESLCYEVMGEDWFKLAQDLGWLNLVYRNAETDESVYAFYHLTFQEYFAALAVKDWHDFLSHVPDNPQQGTYRIFEPQWKEVILLWLGRVEVPAEQKEEFITALVEFEDGCEDFYGFRAYLLAAAGITEFRHCSKSEEIVRQIVERGFDEFWSTFFNTIAEAARDVLQYTQQTKVIAVLVELIRHSHNEYTRYWAAVTLGDINPGNETAITALVELIGNSKDEENRIFVAESLGNIDPTNETAITALVELIINSKDEVTRISAAESLGNIDPTNEVAITTLSQLICNSQSEFTSYWAALSLGNIDPGNKTAITALVKFSTNSQDEVIRYWAAVNLGKFGADNPDAITALLQLIGKDKDEYTQWRAAESLGNIDPGNETAITALVELIRNSKSEYTQGRAAKSLGNVGIGNFDAISALVELVGNSKSEFTRWRAAESLGNIDPGNRTAITTLVELIGNSSDEFTRRRAAESLGNVDPGNETAITALLDLIRNSLDEVTCREVVTSLKKILVKDEQMVGVVCVLKDTLFNQTCKNDSDLFKECYEVIWHCAQTLPYPTFYDAWHHPSHTPHPEVTETTGVGFCAGILQRNLAQLPQLLNAALVETELIDSVQLICTDGSNFFDQDNPVLEIYDAMLDSGCPERSNGEPTKIAELKLYYKSLCRNGEKRPILLFYENPAVAPPQGFSETFLNALSKFDRKICIVSDQANIPLQSFSPNQPNLIADIVGWIRGIVMES